MLRPVPHGDEEGSRNRCANVVQICLYRCPSVLEHQLLTQAFPFSQCALKAKISERSFHPRAAEAHENAGPTNASEVITGSQVNFFFRLTHFVFTIDNEILASSGGGGGTAGGKSCVFRRSVELKIQVAQRCNWL